ncbi:MAG: GNAT family protein [Haloarculaceae archaeon]
MPGPVFQAGDRVDLHTVEEDDLDAFARAHNDPDVRVPLAIDSPENRDDLEERFEDEISDDENVHLLACVDGDPVGATMFIRLDESDGNAILAYWILPEFQGEGYGTEAVSLLLDYGFHELRLHRVEAHCLATNDASRGLLETLGFEREGRSRDRQFQHGQYVDMLQYGLLAEEWRDA